MAFLKNLFRKKSRADNPSQSKQNVNGQLPFSPLHSVSDKNTPHSSLFEPSAKASSSRQEHKNALSNGCEDLTPHSAELQSLCVIFETLNKFKQAGLLYFDFVHHNVTIAQVLAEFYIYSDDDWQRFLHQLHLWAAYQHSINEYNRLYTKSRADEEASAYRTKNLGRTMADSLPLTDAERHLARLRASQRFDAERADKPVLPLPDIHFLVLGIADGKPIIVARLINGKYETAAVPDIDAENS